MVQCMKLTSCVRNCFLSHCSDDNSLDRYNLHKVSAACGAPEKTKYYCDLTSGYMSDIILTFIIQKNIHYL